MCCHCSFSPSLAAGLRDPEHAALQTLPRHIPRISRPLCVSLTRRPPFLSVRASLSLVELHSPLQRAQRRQAICRECHDLSARTAWQRLTAPYGTLDGVATPGPLPSAAAVRRIPLPHLIARQCSDIPRERVVFRFSRTRSAKKPHIAALLALPLLLDARRSSTGRARPSAPLPSAVCSRTHRWTRRWVLAATVAPRSSRASTSGAQRIAEAPCADERDGPRRWQPKQRLCAKRRQQPLRHTDPVAGASKIVRIGALDARCGGDWRTSGSKVARAKDCASTPHARASAALLCRARRRAGRQARRHGLGPHLKSHDGPGAREPAICSALDTLDRAVHASTAADAGNERSCLQ